MPSSSTRKLALSILEKVLINHNNLDQAFVKILPKGLSNQNRSWIKALSFGVLRTKTSLDYLLRSLSEKRKSKFEPRLNLVMNIGLYQILFMKTKPHAAVFETVELAKRCHLGYASAYVNAILQKAVRSGVTLLSDIPESVSYYHPDWLLHALKQAYPQSWQTIRTANLTHPPFFLRVNVRQTTRDAYLQKLHDYQPKTSTLSSVAIELVDAVDPTCLPQFAEGYASVQDLAAGQAAFLLDLKNGQRVLDACAAPGGKACHILETANVELIAVDQNAQRLERVQENLMRLKLEAQTLAADATTLQFPSQHFDRILLDAPCSGTGVIRRHPDILYLRQATDIPKLAATQLQLLHHLWPMLKSGGILLYATCSVLPQENDAVMTVFLENTPDAKTERLNFPSGEATAHGWQFLPQPEGEDGFYYCKLFKT